MLRTRKVTLTSGSVGDADTEAPYSSSPTVEVTNTTGQIPTGSVSQQVVFYDAAGRLVGGDTGSSGNVPDGLPAGMS
jgi:hypothetical protein